MEPEGGKEQDTLIPCRIFQGQAERPPAEGNGAEMVARPVSWRRAVLEEGASLLRSIALGRCTEAVKT